MVEEGKVNKVTTPKVKDLRLIPELHIAHGPYSLRENCYSGRTGRRTGEISDVFNNMSYLHMIFLS